MLAEAVAQTQSAVSEATRLAEWSRVNSSTAVVIASGGSAEFNRSSAARSRDTSTTSLFVSRSNVPVKPMNDAFGNESRRLLAKLAG